MKEPRASPKQPNIMSFYVINFAFKVKWARDNYHHDLNSPYILRLASGDAAGNVILWDIPQGISVTEFSDGNRPILDLEWLRVQDACHDLLVVLHAPSSMILWNADTGTKLWKKTFQETLLCFAFDPFTPCNVTCKLPIKIISLIIMICYSYKFMQVILLPREELSKSN